MKLMRSTSILIVLFGINSFGLSQQLVQEDYCTNGLCPLDSLSKAFVLFGQPLKVEWIESNGDSTQHLSFNGIDIYGDQTGSVVRYEISSDLFRTSRNITIGDSSSVVKKVYGDPKKVTWANDLVYGSETMFYSFELKNDLVVKIIVGFYHQMD